MFKKILTFVMLPLIFLGCEGDLNLNIRYDKIQGLEKEARVIFEQNQIGTVKSVSYDPAGHYFANVAVKREFANAVTEHSKFFIVTDSQDKDKKAIEITLSQKEGVPLKDGATVEGSTKSSGFFDQLRDKFDEGLGGIKKQFDKFVNGLHNIPEGEDFKELENELNQLAEEMRRSGESTREKIQKEVLPKLREELENLRKRLEEFGREQEMEPLEDKMEEIKRI